MLLEFEAENPDAGDTTGPIPGVAPARVEQLVQNVIYGGNVVIAAAPGSTAQQIVVLPGDLDSLLAWARNAGIPENALRELPASIEQEGQSLGEKTKHWAKEAAKAAAGIGRDVAVAVIEAEIKRYLGLP